MRSVQSFSYIRKESFIERLIQNKIAWLVVILFSFSFPIYRSIHRRLPKPLPVYGKLSDFRLFNQFGKPFYSKNLNGQVTIASFAFTSCPTTCPQIMKKMQLIQKRVRGLGTKITLLTFSVDPLHDTPKVLFKYAQKLHANPFIWYFLTGKKEVIKNIVTKDFMLAMGNKEEVKKKLDRGDISVYDIAHSGKVVLLDQKRRIRGYYSLDKTSINKLMIDTGLLINNAFDYN